VFRLLLWAIAAIFRPKTVLIAENLCLRQQLLVLHAVFYLVRLATRDGDYNRRCAPGAANTNYIHIRSSKTTDRRAIEIFSGWSPNKQRGPEVTSSPEVSITEGCY
jgi:hypothetical protein